MQCCPFTYILQPLEPKYLPQNPNLKILYFSPSNAELNPICYITTLLGAHYILHVSRIRVNLQIFDDSCTLTFWRRNYFFLILAHPVYKM